MAARKPQYERRFDWDLAIAMVDDGHPKSVVAKHFGVTGGAVARVMLPEDVRRVDDLRRAETMRDLCACGRKKTRRERRCHHCVRMERVENSTSIRVVGPCEDGLFWPELRCGKCREWKWSTAFGIERQRNEMSRGGRRRWCKACETKLRQDYRKRHKVPCDLCGKPRLSDAEKLPGLKRARAHRLWPFCRECLYHSDAPEAVAARAAIQRLAREKT